MGFKILSLVKSYFQTIAKYLLGLYITTAAAIYLVYIASVF
jgi:hypothetical protein